MMMTFVGDSGEKEKGKRTEASPGLTHLRV